MLKRRNFIKKAGAASLTLGLPATGFAQQAQTPKKKPLLKPKRLTKGQVVGLVAPGYAITDQMLQNSLTALKALGLEAYHTQRIFGKHGYLANTDQERAKDLMHMFTNPKVAAIFCIRGGYGCTRILDLLDFELIAQNPKILLGYSDITALVNPFYTKTGLVGFHGAMGPAPNSYAFNCIKTLLFKPQKKHTLNNFMFDEEQLQNPVYQAYTITPGKATGTLVGGNLSLLAALNGTDYAIDYTDAIVCIEDVGEAPYRIDRMLTQLLATPSFKKAKAVVFGVCAGCDKKPDAATFSLKEVILDRIAPLGIPAVYGMSFGHIEESFTFPIGTTATLDATKHSLTLTENPLT